ncbi:MAG: hypothetical protein ABIT83_19065 [Massilia sp.]
MQRNNIPAIYRMAMAKWTEMLYKIRRTDSQRTARGHFSPMTERSETGRKRVEQRWMNRNKCLPSIIPRRRCWFAGLAVG